MASIGVGYKLFPPLVWCNDACISTNFRVIAIAGIIFRHLRSCACVCVFSSCSSVKLIVNCAGVCSRAPKLCFVPSSVRGCRPFAYFIKVGGTEIACSTSTLYRVTPSNCGTSRITKFNVMYLYNVLEVLRKAGPARRNFAKLTFHIVRRR